METARQGDGKIERERERQGDNDREAQMDEMEGEIQRTSAGVLN